MSRVEELRAQLAVAELEDRLAAVKDSGTAAEVQQHEADLRYARWVARGGPQHEQLSVTRDEAHTSRAAEALYARWSAEQRRGKR